MSKIFINFRAGDAQDAAVLIDQKLCGDFGRDNVFRSSWSIPPSKMFEPEIIKAVDECTVMLVVIGPNWLSPDENGVQRLFAPADWVRTEIELALAAKKAVIPILVGDRKMPERDELPQAIGSIVSHQYIRLHHRSAEYCLMQIVDGIRRLGTTDTGLSMPRPTAPLLLTSLRPTQRSSDVRLGAADINGRHYGDSIIYRCTVFANEPRGSISFNLGRQYRHLDVTVGVLDDAADADQTGVFRVILDGTLREEVAAKQGQPRSLAIDLTGVLNLKLLAYRPGTTEHPLMAGVRMAGGQSNNLPELAWGNPTVRP